MNRIITILVTIFILLLGYIWISHVWGTEKPRQPADIVEANELDAGRDLQAEGDTAYTPPMTDPMADDGSNDEYRTEPAAGAEGTGTQTPAEPEPEPVKSEPVKTPSTPEKKPVETKPAPAKPVETKTETKPETKPATKPVTKPVAANTGSLAGKHLVIAGNFSQSANAEQRVQELKKAGYPNAEVIQFDMSQYHTVCAGGYDDVNEARRVAKKLRDYHKIDAYVRIGG